MVVLQRRRRDIDAWREPGLFPQRDVADVKYRLTGEYERFYEEILEIQIWKNLLIPLGLHLHQLLQHQKLSSI